MKKYWHAFFMSFGMFTSIPCPYRPWNDDARPLMILFFPIIGVILGALWMLAGMLLRWLELPLMISAAILTILPYALTGFLHLDGYMDVSDAILSRRPLADRQRILKDPHVGSFAVIMVCCLFLVHFSLFASMPEGADLKMLLLLPAAVRSSAGIAVSAMRPMSTSQYAGNYRTSVRLSHLILLGVLFLLTLGGSWLLSGWQGILCLAAGALVYWLAVLLCARDLDGINGDISGFGLVLGELAGVAVMILIGG